MRPAMGWMGWMACPKASSSSSVGTALVLEWQLRMVGRGVGYNLNVSYMPAQVLTC